MDFQLNRKYNKHISDCKILSKEIQKYIQKFTFGYQYNVIFSTHFSHRCVERGIPLNLVYNTALHLFNNNRFDFRNYKNLFITSHRTIFVLRCEHDGDYVKIFFVSALDNDKHKIGMNTDCKFITISLNELMVKEVNQSKEVCKNLNYDDLIDNARKNIINYVETL